MRFRGNFFPGRPAFGIGARRGPATGRETGFPESEPTLGSPDRGTVGGNRTIAPVCARLRNPAISKTHG